MGVYLTYIEDNMTDESPIREGWITVKKIKRVYKIPESTLRTWAGQVDNPSRDAQGNIILNRKVVEGLSYYWEADIIRLYDQWQKESRGKRKKREG